MQNREFSERMKIRPLEMAGDALHKPSSGFRAKILNVRSAAITTVEPSSARQYNRPSATTGESP
jgi:hypothetical protein